MVPTHFHLSDPPTNQFKSLVIFASEISLLIFSCFFLMEVTYIVNTEPNGIPVAGKNANRHPAEIACPYYAIQVAALDPAIKLPAPTVARQEAQHIRPPNRLGEEGYTCAGDLIPMFSPLENP